MTHRINPTALLALARKLALPAAFKTTQGEIQSLAADYVAQATRIAALEAGLVEALSLSHAGLEYAEDPAAERAAIDARHAALRALAEGKP